MSRISAFLLNAIGRTMIAIGVLTLLFAGFQLWGTGLAEAQSQGRLEDQFRARLAEANGGPVTPTAPPAEAAPGSGGAAAHGLSEGDQAAPADIAAESRGLEVQADPVEVPDADSPETDSPEAEVTAGPTPVALTADQVPQVGDAVGVIEIPAIGVTKTFVEGTTRDVLRAGPGHYDGTPLPGQPGNAAIAGHRTTHGAPFFDIDLLEPGDEILVETLQGRFTYLVEGHDGGRGQETGHRIVAPTEVSVIGDHGDDRLTLTACHPKYSARQRIVVSAVLTSTAAPTHTDLAVGPVDAAPTALATEPVPTAARPTEALPTQGGASPANEADCASVGADAPHASCFPPSEGAGDDGVTDSLGWQPHYATPTVQWAAITAMIALAGWTIGYIWRRWPAYLMAFPAFTFALFQCFTNLDRFIPAV